MITVTRENDPFSNDNVYVVRVPRRDMRDIDLDPIDRAVLAEPVVTAADVLQNLEILAFRQAQQHKDNTLLS